MPERYVEAIMKFLAGRDYQPLKPRQLARQLGVSQEQYDTFRDAVKRLRDAGRVVLGSRNALTLPDMPSRVVGTFRANRKGFGFVVPETPNAHGDLFVPAEATAGAMTGDRVVARAQKRGKREGQTIYAGEIVEILQRGQNRLVGTLQESDQHWFVLPDGKQFFKPVVVRDVGKAGPKAGTKVVVEILEYGQEGQFPSGVIVESLGEAGPIDVETRAVIRAHGIPDEFSPAALDDARAAVAAFDPEDATNRTEYTSLTVVTIDPDTARDYDDAISITPAGEGKVELGVHIADVSHFVVEGTALDAEARERGTSVYFPRRVVPMLPEILSNGVCSLQEGERRFVKSAFITYDADGRVVAERFSESVICSTRRLTYTQAQEICDGKTGGHPKKVVQLVQAMQTLARTIEQRRRAAGMLHLDLPEVELVFDENDRVVDAVPEDNAYTHTIIEMFMVEANEAVARLMNRLERPILRRIHPEPDPASAKQVAGFIRAAGHRLPADLDRKALQQLLADVRDRPEGYAVNLAVLKTFQAAEYSPRMIGHYALASEHYCHFTSPIRRYPDLTVHRLLAEHCRGTLKSRPPEDLGELVSLGEHCTAVENRAESAENELRDVIVLQLLAGRVGERFDGVITGVTNFGLFVQSRQFLIEGLIRMEDLGDDWWEVSARYGQLRGEHTGKVYRIGDVLGVRIAGVDLAKRQLNLVPDRDQPAKNQGKGNRRAKSKTTSKASSKGKGKAKSKKSSSGKRAKGK